MIDVRPATEADIDACARVLALAFQDDPGTRHFEPDDERRRRMLPAFFRAFVAASLAEQADLDVTGDPVDGIASWYGPERHSPSTEAMRAAGMGAVIELAGTETVQRMAVMGAEIERQHELLAPGPHLRLEFYGVAPDRQGVGLGTALIEHGHRRADALGLPCYLETFSDENVVFYRRRGYEVVGEFALADGTPGWGMIRPAAPVALALHGTT